MFAGVVIRLTVDHVVFPLDPAGRLAVSWPRARGRRGAWSWPCSSPSWPPRLGDELRRQQLHAAFRAVAGLLADDLGASGRCSWSPVPRPRASSALRARPGCSLTTSVHRAGVDDRSVAVGASMSISATNASVLSGSASRYGAMSLPLGGQVRVDAQGRELPSQRRLGGLVGDGDRGERDRSGRACGAPASSSPGSVEQDVDDDPLRTGPGRPSSTNCSCSTRPLSPPTSFIRAPGSATLNTRVLAVLVR